MCVGTHERYPPRGLSQPQPHLLNHISIPTFNYQNSTEMNIQTSPLILLFQQRCPMPGTIQVSVFDMVGFPTSSISIKVFMGKKEYQSLGTGDFSFPLSNIRDKLIVTLNDFEGKELSRTGFETLLLVQNGSCNEIITFEGGGHLHMNLQFILNEGERKRIQKMRESALKKKNGEILSSNQRHSETLVREIHGISQRHSGTVVVDTVRHDIGPSINHEATDSQAIIIQMEAATAVERSIDNNSIVRPANNNSIERPIDSNSMSSTISYSRNEEHHHGNEEHLVKTTPNKADGSEGTSTSTPPLQVLKVPHLNETNQPNAEKTDSLAPQDDVPTRPIPSREAPEFTQSLLAKNNNSISNSLEEDQNSTFEKQSASAKTPSSMKKMKAPSSVRNMISAFETNLSQGVGPRASAPAVKTLNKSKIDTLKGLTENNASTEKMKTFQKVVEKELNPLLARTQWDMNVEKSLKYTRIRRDQTDHDVQNIVGASDRMPKSHSSGMLETLLERNTAPEEIGSPEQVKSKTQHRKEEMNGQEKVVEELAGTSTETVLNPFLARKQAGMRMEESSKYTTIRRDLTGPDVQTVVQVSDRISKSHSSGQLELLIVRKTASDEVGSREQIKSKIQHNIEEMDGQEKVVEELMGMSASDPMVSKIKRDGLVSINQTCYVHNDKKECLEEESATSTEMPTISRMELDRSMDRSTSLLNDKMEHSEELIEASAERPTLSRVMLDRLAGITQILSVRSYKQEHAKVVGASAETLPVSRIMSDHPMSIEQSSSVNSDNKNSGVNVFEESAQETCKKELHGIDVCEISSEEWKSQTHPRLEQYSYESSGSWIFPDEIRQLCITTGSKQMIDHLGGCGDYDETNRRKSNLSRTERLKEEITDGDTSHKMRDSMVKSSTSDKASGVLIDQAVRIAIMVAFGALVIVTRQRTR